MKGIKNMYNQYEGNAEVKLNIIKDCSCNFLLSYAYPLSIAETNSNYMNWNNQNYIYHFFSYNKFRHMNSGILDALEYGYNQRISNQIFEYDEIDYQSLVAHDSIVNYIINMLNEQRYIIIFLDNKELRFTENHCMHEYLIYGYNKDIQVFYTLYYNNNNKYTYNTISFNDLSNAYKSLIENMKYLDNTWMNKIIMIFKLNISGINSLKYNPEIFYTKIENYARSEMIDNIYLEDDVAKQSFTSGISTTYGLSQYLVDLRNFDNRINYGQIYDIVKTIQLFYQHRVGIFNKSTFYQNNTRKILSQKLNLYNDVISELKTIQLLLLKVYFRALNEPSLDAGKNLVTISERLQKVYTNECEIWNHVLI